MHRWIAFIMMVFLLGVFLIILGSPNRPVRKKRGRQKVDTSPGIIISGLLAGTLIGGFIGIITNNLAVGIALGPGMGIALGIAITLSDRKSSSDEQNRRWGNYRIWIYPAILVLILIIIWLLRIFFDLHY